MVDVSRARFQEQHIQEFQKELAELDKDVLDSMEIRKQDAVERALDHSRDDLPRLKRLAAANKYAWLPASTKLGFMNAILPNSSGDGNSPRSLHPDALQQETSQLQKQIVDVSAESKAEKELLTGKKLQAEIQTLVTAVVAAFEAYSQQRPEVDRLLQEVQQHVDLASRPARELPPVQEDSTEDELRRLLAATAEEALSLEQTAADNQAACQQLWQDMEADELLLAETETRVSQLCEQKDAEGAHEARFRQATAKAKQLLDMQSKLSGLRVEVRTDDIVVHLTTEQNDPSEDQGLHTHQLRLLLPDDSLKELAGRSLAAVLQPPTIHIEDVLNEAAPGWAGMNYVVLETQRRLRSHYAARITETTRTA